MSTSPSERCPKCGLPKGEVVEIRAQATKATPLATAMTPRKTGIKRISGVRFAEFPSSIVTLYRCKKCGHEFTKTTA